MPQTTNSMQLAHNDSFTLWMWTSQKENRILTVARTNHAKLWQKSSKSICNKCCYIEKEKKLNIILYTQCKTTKNSGLKYMKGENEQTISRIWTPQQHYVFLEIVVKLRNTGDCQRIYCSEWNSGNDSINIIIFISKIRTTCCLEATANTWSDFNFNCKCNKWRIIIILSIIIISIYNETIMSDIIVRA